MSLPGVLEAQQVAPSCLCDRWKDLVDNRNVTSDAGGELNDGEGPWGMKGRLCGVVERHACDPLEQ